MIRTCDKRAHEFVIGDLDKGRDPAVLLLEGLADVVHEQSEVGAGIDDTAVTRSIYKKGVAGEGKGEKRGRESRMKEKVRTKTAQRRRKECEKYEMKDTDKRNDLHMQAQRHKKANIQFDCCFQQTRAGEHRSTNDGGRE